MTPFQIYYNNIKNLLDIGEYDLLAKRLIDLTLDTEDVSFYKKTLDFLDWQERNKAGEQRVVKMQALLDELYQCLEKKPLKERQRLFYTNNLIKSYSHSGFALGPITLEVSEGEILGLVGENGNGKTTLLRTLCGELEPTNGVLNYDFDYKDEYDLRSKLIYIPQRTDTWQGSLLDNLQFTAASYGIKGEENICLVDLIINRMGLREYREYKWKSLSSGYKMRFELARMLLRKPKLLLIDEPLANLDILAQQMVLDDFKDMAKSPFRPLGIILSSQQLYEVEKTSDQVIFLRKGVPRSLQGIETETKDYKEIIQFIVEFESETSYEELKQILTPLELEKLQIKGGTYVAYFPERVIQNDFLSVIITSGITLNYYRNISNSTRRFFLS